MERGSIVKFLFIGVAVFLFFQYGYGALFGSDEASELQPLGPVYTFPDPDSRLEDQRCAIKGPRFEASLSSRGGSLRSVRLTDAKYVTTVSEPDAKKIQLVTTNPDIPGVWESRMPMRTNLRVPLASEDLKQQVEYDNLDWKLTEQTESSCTFVHETESVRVVKRVATTDRPFELALVVELENRSSEARSHRYTVEQSSFRTAEESEGSLGTLGEFMTNVDALTDTGVERLDASDFEPEEFASERFTPEKWYRVEGSAKWAAVSSSYMTRASIHVEGPARPFADLLIEEHFNPQKYPNKENDPDFGHTYRARLAYPVQELAPQASARYESLVFVGPKERDVLAAIGSTPGSTEDRYGTSDVIDLGFFGAIGEILVRYIYWLYGLVGNWGWAICLLTITVKLGLFPLSIAQIKSGIAMRRLKPEMDEINEKYKDDATQRGLAIQELWRREKVANPVVGCVPLLLQMPVWFSLYRVLQTAVELYHTPFGPFIPDMSQPGLYYIIPIVLGASSYYQQTLMPPQGDPAQQKMMRYAMPAMFTVFMLFLPAGLGVYMLTNTWLGILQTVAVEKFMKSRVKPSGDDDSTDATASKGGKSDSGSKKDNEGAALEAAPVLRKGKARARG